LDAGAPAISKLLEKTMKMLRYAMYVMLLLTTAAAAVAQSDGQRAFDKLKSMAGTWEGKMSDGQSVTMTYSLVSGGTAVMADASHESMVTMYTLDGDRVLMTHFCATGNQPRMAAALSPDGKSLEFNFIDASNLATPQSGHMHHAIFAFADANHYTEEWTWAKDGQNRIEHFDLHRKN
jgi:hypothetical protein